VENKPDRAHQSALDRPVSFPTGSNFGLPERELSNLRSSICGFDGEDVDSWIPATSAGMTLKLSFSRPIQTTGHPGPCARDPACRNLERVRIMQQLWTQLTVTASPVRHTVKSAPVRRMQCEMRTYVLAGSELLLPREASAIVDAQICSLPTANAESWIPATSAGMTLNLGFNLPSQTTGHPGPCARDPSLSKRFRRQFGTTPSPRHRCVRGTMDSRDRPGMTFVDYSAARISSSSVSPGRTIVKATGFSVISTWPSRREATV